MREGLPHIVVPGFNKKEKFKPKGVGRNPLIPTQDRGAHGGRIFAGYNNAISEGSQRKAAVQPLTEESGIYLEVRSFPRCQLQLDSLDTKKSYHLQSWHLEGEREIAVIFVPDSK